ncbi:MAG: histone deacetylase family protein [Pseudomonadota bacterium]
MTTAFISHTDFLDHVMPPGHPERVDRLVAINRALEDPRFDPLLRELAPLADDTLLQLAHPQSYIDRLRAAAPEEGFVSLDPDTHMSPGTFDAALRAAGGAARAVEMVLSGAASNAFVAGRPPGHHAETERAMGFCLFGNAVIAARKALELGEFDRVAIVDFDVHHGNGTQDLVWEDERIMFLSTHQMPLFPGSGARSERGAHGQIVNLPLNSGSDGRVLAALTEAEIVPAIEAFAPQFLIISAGFDAHADDPLASLMWREADFAKLTRALCGLADRHCEGRLVATLEGGYDLGGLAGSLAAHLQVLMEHGA